jgi:hypothetical protein
MAKFLVLYRSPMSPKEQMANMSPEDTKAGMDAWMAWAGHAGEAVLDLGAPLDGARHVGDGSGDPVGYSLLQADSADDAVAVLNEHPHVHGPGNSIDVHELIPLPGM